MSGLLLAPAIAIAVLLLAALVLAAQKGRQRSLVGRVVHSHPVAATPAILFFTGANCHVCHVAQKPALDALAVRLGGRIRIDEIDVAARPELARAYRVMTLPTTVVLDAVGVVTDINVGFASLERLNAQLRSLGVPVAA